PAEGVEPGVAVAAGAEPRPADLPAEPVGPPVLVDAQGPVGPLKRTAEPGCEALAWRAPGCTVGHENHNSFRGLRTQEFFVVAGSAVRGCRPGTALRRCSSPLTTVVNFLRTVVRLP